MLFALLSGCEPDLHTFPKDSADTAEPAPFALLELAPDSGPAAGGTTVSVRGTGLTAATTATVGGAPCASLTWLSSEELACVTPPGAAGEARFAVTEDGAEQSLPFSYTDGADTGDTGADTGDGRDSGTDSADSGADTGPDTGQDTAVATEPVDYCHLQWPCTMSAAAGTQSDVVYGWVYEGSVTEGVGRGTLVTMEVGVGPDGSDPATSAGWTWSSMSYNVDKDGLFPGDLANDEWMGTFTVPAAGAWDFAVRATADGGASFAYCDVGGDTCGGAGTDDGYDPADAGQLTAY